REYIKIRGISEESIDHFALGYAPDSWEDLGRAAAKNDIPSQLILAAGLTKQRPGSETVYDVFRNRLMFHIRDALNRTIGFGGRALGDDPAKYLNTAQNALFDKSRSLYGVNLAKRAFEERSRTAVVVEGYTDCVLAHQHGFGHTVATLGTALTVEHVRLLRRYVDTVILVFDSDEAGRRAADHSLRLFLGEQLDIRLANVPEAKDPAELLQNAGAEAFERVLTSASDALEFKWRQLLRQYQDLATGPGRRRAIEEFLQLIAISSDQGACDPIQRGLRLNQVGKLLGLTSDEVSRQLRIIARRSSGAPGGGRQAAQARPTGAGDAASAAMHDLLEVLLNEPSYYASIESEFDPELIPDAEVREIAKAVAALARENPDFSLPELITRFESVQTAQRIVVLQTAGEQGGNFAARIEGAIQRLQQIREQRRIGELTAGLRHQDGKPADAVEEGLPGEETDGEAADVQTSARAMSQRARQMHHFAAGRHLSASLPGRGEPRPGE
ncbi:MAG: toprim domain-containing protein, partial [Dehalococcoidia bacterium]